MIVLNVTFFILLLLAVIGQWAGSVRDDSYRGGGHPFFFFYVYFTVNIFFFYFDVKPKCGYLF